jgi:hypothetical protein
MVKLMAPLPPALRPLFLQHLERMVKAENDFLGMRAVRAYQKHLSSPTSTPPPKSA